MIQDVRSGLRINCPAARRETIAINSNKWQNKNREANHDKKRVTKGAAELGQVKSHEDINELKKAYQAKIMDWVVASM